MGLTPYVHLDADLAGAAAGDRIPLAGDDLHHLRRVLRLPVGADVEVADGRGRAAVAALLDDGVRLVADPVGSAEPAVRVIVVQALAKGRKLDDVVRQVTELGADAVVPVVAARSVARLDGDRAARAVERWSAVARAASEQARRPRRPVVEPVRPVAELADAVDGAALLVAHPGGPALPDVVADVVAAGAAHVAVAVGPEGGWTDVEVAALVAAGGHLAGLGPSVLRTEHAAAAAVAVVAAVTGRWR